MRQPSVAEAQQFLDRADFVWYQRFDLAPGVTTPGTGDAVRLLAALGLPPDLTGWRVLDIGTTNGAIAFALEARGAEVIAIDIVSPDLFGFSALRDFYESKVSFLRASVYELPDRLDGEFDVVVLSGVLYHLRYPLLALDRIRSLCRGPLLVETAVCDHELPPDLRAGSYARFYRTNELAGDGSNWFAPTVAALADWLRSSGFEIEHLDASPRDAATRAIAIARRTDGPAEYRTVGYEWPVIGIQLASGLDPGQAVV